jgi:homoisocitrate dehydrogenase
MKVCVIPGDGIGPEVVDAAMRVLQVLVPDVELVEAQAGWQTFQQEGHALPAATLETARTADAIFFGAVASPSHPVPGYRSPIVEMRRTLELYANIRPVRGVSSTISGVGIDAHRVDLVVVRENTEGLYSGRERLEDDGNTAIAERVITRHGSQRVLRQAFELARERARRREQEVEIGPRLPKVTVVHKANVLRVTDGLFREIALEMGRQYPEIAVEELLVDTAAMHVAQVPKRFDVIVTTNLYGDILSDIACIHGGGLGMASSANLGDQQALFEPVHGAAPDIVGRGVANPLAALDCVGLLLEWALRRQLIEEQQTKLSRSALLRAAIADTLRTGLRTPDIGGNATTDEVTDAVLAYVQARLA